MADLPIVGVLGLPFVEPPLVQTVLELVEGDLDVVARDREFSLDAVPHFLDELLQMAVQPFGVHGIARVLHDLQPVAGHDRVAHLTDRGFDDETVELRNQGRRLRAEVAPDHPAELGHGVAADVDLVLERTAFGFVRLVETCAGAVELPAVIRAANAVSIRNAVV